MSHRGQKHAHEKQFHGKPEAPHSPVSSASQQNASSTQEPKNADNAGHAKKNGSEEFDTSDVKPAAAADVSAAKTLPSPRAPASVSSPASESKGRPSWWNDTIENSWTRARREAIADWDASREGSKRLEQGVIEKAMALGHGASEAYERLHSWGNELEEKLRADWKETGVEAEAAWEKVRETVKHAWERASKTARAARSIPPLHL